MADFDEAHDALVDHRKTRTDLTPIQGTTTELSIPRLVQTVNDDGVYYLSTLPDEGFQQRLQIARYMSSKENDIEKLLTPNSFPVSNFILTKASFNDSKGEEVTTPKLVLISDKGETMSVLAKVFVMEFLVLVQAMGVPPWPEPINVSAKLQKGNGSNRYYTIHLP